MNACASDLLRSQNVPTKIPASNASGKPGGARPQGVHRPRFELGLQPWQGCVIPLHYRCALRIHRSTGEPLKPITSTRRELKPNRTTRPGSFRNGTGLELASIRRITLIHLAPEEMVCGSGNGPPVWLAGWSRRRDLSTGRFSLPFSRRSRPGSSPLPSARPTGGQCSGSIGRWGS